MTPETRLLTADLHWIPAGKLAVGDALLAPEAEVSLPAHRRWRRSVIEEAHETVKPCCRLTLDDGTILACSMEHELLADHRLARRWRQAWEVKSGEGIVRLIDTWEPSLSREGGYLAAAFDGEGSLRQNPFKLRTTSNGQGTALGLGFTQKDNEMLAETRRCLEALGFPYSDINHDGDRGQRRIQITERAEVLRFLGEVRPLRLLAKFDASGVGAAHTLRVSRMVAKESLGSQPVVILKTSTQTFVAEGWPSHCGHRYADDCGPGVLH